MDDDQKQKIMTLIAAIFTWILCCGPMYVMGVVILVQFLSGENSADPWIFIFVEALEFGWGIGGFFILRHLVRKEWGLTKDKKNRKG